jgi:hypothetical protein
MNIRMLASGLVLAVATFGVNASAGNTTLAGSACQAYQGVNESLLLHSFLGCINQGSSAFPVIFGETRVNQGTAQTLYVDYIGSNSSSSTLLCNAYLYPFDGGPAVWSQGFSATCGSTHGVFSYSVPANAWGYLTVYCNLPPNCRLLGSALTPG